MWSFLGKLTQRIAAAIGVAVILLGIAFGAFRLLVTQLPGYQDDIQAWVNDSLGLTLAFERLDARWGLSGPELTFHGASVATGEGGQSAVTARSASIGFNAAALITERRLTVSRLTLDGIDLTLFRGEQGRFRLQGLSLADAMQTELAIQRLPPVRLLVRNSRVSYVDHAEGLTWDFDDVSLDLDRQAERVVLQARAAAPAQLGDRIEFSIEGALAPDGGTSRDWRLFTALRDVRLAQLAELFPAQAVLPHAGRGDVSLWLDIVGGRLARGTAEVAVDDLVLSAVRLEETTPYQRLAFMAEWERGDDRWQLSVSELDLARGGRSWSGGGRLDLSLERDALGGERLFVQSDFLRLEDLTPVLALLPESRLTERWRALALRGDLIDTELVASRSGEAWEYTLTGQFADLAVAAFDQWPGLAGVSGEVRADSRSGRLTLASRDVELSWPALFPAPIEADDLAGVFVWRRGVSGWRIVSDNLAIGNADATVRSNFELTLPAGGGSPRLELATALSDFDATAAKRYLPTGILPPAITEWFTRAVVGGRIENGRLTFLGPLAAFPFDGGEGEVRAAAEIADGSLAFLPEWPSAEDLNGTIEFANTGFRAEGGGRVLGNVSDDLQVAIDDVRDAVVVLRGQTDGPLADVLAFVRRTPLLARHVGLELDRLTADAGRGGVSLDLMLPLGDRAAFRLNGQLRVADAALSLERFALRATEIAGLIDFDERSVTSGRMDGVLLDGPVTARIEPSTEAGYPAVLELDGEVPAAALVDALRLPVEDGLAGQARWRGSLRVPSIAAEPRPPLLLDVASSLSGMALRLPAPFSKPPAEPMSLQLRLRFPEASSLEVEGSLGATRRVALSFEQGPDGFAFERGELSFGGGVPRRPRRPGLRIEGRLPALSLDEWLELPGVAASTSLLDGTLAAGDLQIADFGVFGQRLGSTQLAFSRGVEQWLIRIDSEPIAGSLSVPRDSAQRSQITADMDRLRLSSGRGRWAGGADPRKMPGLLLRAAEFALGGRRFGELYADIQADPLGLRLVSFQAGRPSFTIHGSGGWFDDGAGATTRLAFSLTSDDVAATLDSLDLGRVVEGERAEVTASVYWPGDPSADWIESLSGDLAVDIEDGSILDLEPGAGRVMGLMSITALPRRLSLDFRDVFNRGLVFDRISGDFTIIDGDAYTDNLKLTGPVAEIGVAGRTGLDTHDYEQHAVVTAEPGKMLPTVGGLLAGPGVGAALLIFTQIFKEPLKGIGRASYCVTGTWEDPAVERLTPEELEQGRLCADLPGPGLTMLQAPPESGP